MSDATVQQQITSANEPRRWIFAVVGGVLLGEALWSMMHILVRDWAAPALQNAMGQGPTHNAGAFEPLPLVIAFVEACVAGIVLVLLMSLAQRRVKVVVRTVSAPAAAQISVPAVPQVMRVEPVVEPPIAPAVRVEPVVRPQITPPPMPVASQVAPVAVPAPPPAPAVAAPRPAAPAASVASVPAAVQQPVAPAPASAPVAPKPAAVKPAPPKKPKQIYYNSVGEPIEE